MIDTGPPAGSDSGSASWLSAAFDEAAPRYDLMVALNPGYHRELAAAARGLVDGLGPGSARLVDLGCGSGASTIALLRAAGGKMPVTIIGLDASAGMLARAEAKPWPPGVRFERCLAQELARSRAALGIQEPVDGVLAAYLFRNIPGETTPRTSRCGVDRRSFWGSRRFPSATPPLSGEARGSDLLRSRHSERAEVLTAVRDLLRPGGILVVQDYSVAGSRVARLVWTVVCWLVVIPLSWLTQRRTKLYRYLWSSVRRFDSIQTFVDRLRAAGFIDVEVRTARGWQRGILHTVRARRPDEPAE